MENPDNTPGAGIPTGSNGIENISPNPMLIARHISRVLEVILGADRRDLENVGSLLSLDSQQYTEQICARFALENQLAIFVMKELISSTAVDGVTGTSCGKISPS